MSLPDARKMVSTVNLLERERIGVPPDAAPTRVPEPPASNLVFRPELFFLGRTEGAGVVRDPFGRLIRRCRITTHGAELTGRAAIQIEERFLYDDGELDVWRWVISPSRDGRYVAAEARAGAGIAGEVRGGEYHLTFRRPVGRASGWLSPRFATCFTQLSPDLALKRAKVGLLGVPLGALLAVHRRVEA